MTGLKVYIGMAVFKKKNDSLGEVAKKLHLSDHQGSLRFIVDATSALTIASWSYSPNGLQKNLFGDLPSHEYDGYAGLRNHESGLLLALFRVYNSDLGRWLNRDPIEENGGLNVYNYVQNDFLGLTDPSGLYAKRNCKSVSLNLGVPTSFKDIAKKIKSIPKLGVFGDLNASGGVNYGETRCEECCGANTWKPIVEMNLDANISFGGELGFGGALNTPVASYWFGGKINVSAQFAGARKLNFGGCNGASGSKTVEFTGNVVGTASGGGNIQIMMDTITLGRATLDGTVTQPGVKLKLKCNSSGCSFDGIDLGGDLQGSLSITGAVGSTSYTHYFLGGP